MIRSRWVLAGMLTALGAATAFAASAPATTPVARRDPTWLARHEAINARVRQGGVDLVFIGDSIVQNWEGNGLEIWQRYYARRKAANLGINGDQTGHVLWRLEHGNIDGISPKLAVVLIGTNNARWAGHSGVEIADGIAAIVEKLRAKLPQTKILLLAIFPRGADDADPLRQANLKANALIARLADHDRVLFLDIGRKFFGVDGKIDAGLMPDRLHPNARGYRIWAEAIEPTVANLLGDSPVR